MDFATIAAAIGAVLISVGLQYLFDSNLRRISPNEQGKKVLKGNKLFQYVGKMFVGIIGFCWIFPIYYKDGEMILGALLMSVLLGLFARYFFRRYNNDWVRFDHEEICIYGRRGDTITLKWEEISRIFYDSISGDICLVHEEGEASFHHMLVGINEFFEEMERQTKWKFKDLNFPFSYKMNY